MLTVLHWCSEMFAASFRELFVYEHICQNNVVMSRLCSLYILVWGVGTGYFGRHVC